MPVPNISVQSVIEVFQPGYRIGERVLRPARVVVGEPMDGAEEAESDSADEPSDSADSGEGEDKK